MPPCATLHSLKQELDFYQLPQDLTSFVAPEEFHDIFTLLTKNEALSVGSKMLRMVPLTFFSCAMGRALFVFSITDDELHPYILHEQTLMQIGFEDGCGLRLPHQLAASDFRGPSGVHLGEAFVADTRHQLLSWDCRHWLLPQLLVACLSSEFKVNCRWLQSITLHHATHVAASRLRGFAALVLQW